MKTANKTAKKIKHAELELIINWMEMTSCYIFLRKKIHP